MVPMWEIMADEKKWTPEGIRTSDTNIARGVAIAINDELVGFAVGGSVANAGSVASVDVSLKMPPLNPAKPYMPKAIAYADPVCTNCETMPPNAKFCGTCGKELHFVEDGNADEREAIMQLDTFFITTAIIVGPVLALLAHWGGLI